MAPRALGLAAIFFALAVAVALGVALMGCGSDQAAVGCASDSDCPTGAHCKAQVCVAFPGGFDASVPDLAGPDLATPPAIDLSFLDGNSSD